MSTRIPLRFWIGRHVDGSGLQCIVDTDGGPMEGVKQAWSPDNPDRLTTLEVVVQPDLTPGSKRLLVLMLGLEKRLASATAPATHELLQAAAMGSYASGLRQEDGPMIVSWPEISLGAKSLFTLITQLEELFSSTGAREVVTLFETIARAARQPGWAQAKPTTAPSP